MPFRYNIRQPEKYKPSACGGGKGENMERFKLVHVWEGRPDEYAAYFLHERMKADGCVDKDGRVELVQRNGMFCQAPTLYERKELARLLRPRVIHADHIIRIECQIHPLTCINFAKEQTVVAAKQAKLDELSANISLLSDREREELIYLKRWLHENQVRAYFTQYDEYTHEYFVRMYQLTLSDSDTFFTPEQDVRPIIGEKLFEALTPNSPAC